MNPLGKKSVLCCLVLKSRLWIGICSALLISACAGVTSNTVYDTFKLGISNPNSVINATPLNPNYRYLKVEANGQPALLVLGYVDQRDKASHDVWYSAFKEALEIRGGRLAATAGLEVNWTDVRIADAPPLLEVLTAQEASRGKRPMRMRYTRVRTVMPGYHVNIRETVVMEVLQEAPSAIPKELKAASHMQDIRWVQEVVQVPTQSIDPSIKPLRAIYAIDFKTGEVVYGKQELTPHFYVSWLRWPYPPTSRPGQKTP